MNLLLDTCTALWLFFEIDRLPARIQASLEDEDVAVYLHQASLIEIQIKHGLGRLPLPAEPRLFLPEAMTRHYLTPATFEDEAIWLLGKLPDHHGDPFDRLLITHAIIHGWTIVTPDPAIHRYPVSVLW